MTIQTRGKWIKLIDTCPVEDAETLHDRLQEKPEGQLDLSRCEHIHSAVLQVLLQQPRPVGRPPEDVFLKSVIVPQLQAAQAASEASSVRHD